MFIIWIENTEVIALKRILVSILSVLILLSVCLPAYGSIGLGTRAMGMGGAFTAVADDESAFYWNPAGITQVRFASLMFGIGVQGEEFDFIEDTIDNISDTEELNPDDFEDGRGYLNLGLIGGLTTKFVGVNFYSESSVNTEKDDTNLEVGASSFNYGAVTIAATIQEKISIGCNIKRVVAGVGGGFVELNINELKIASETSYGDGEGLAYDLGVLYRLNDQIKFGFIARNIGGDIELDGQTTDYITDSEVEWSDTVDLPREYAVGVSYRPFKNTLLSGDIQKCDEREPFTPEQTRIRVGFEQTALWNIFALRLGAYTNKGEPLALTAGLGFKLGPLAIGLAGVREEFDDKEAIEGLVTLGIRF